jgi:hypothetical protein
MRKDVDIGESERFGTEFGETEGVREGCTLVCSRGFRWRWASIFLSKQTGSFVISESQYMSLSTSKVTRTRLGATDIRMVSYMMKKKIILCSNLQLRTSTIQIHH